MFSGSNARLEVGAIVGAIVGAEVDGEELLEPEHNA